MYVICFLPAEEKLWTEKARSKNCFLTPKVNVPVTAQVTVKEIPKKKLKMQLFPSICHRQQKTNDRASFLASGRAFVNAQG